jgi:hypothetical protein
MNPHKELRPEQLKELFQKAASVEVAPEVSHMLNALQKPAEASRLWMLPVMVGVAAIVAALFVLSPWSQTTIKKTPLQPIAYPTLTNKKEQVGAGLTPPNYLKMAEEAAKRKDWQAAEFLAKQAGDDTKAEIYFAEGNAQEFLTLCEDAVVGKMSNDIYTYCYDALKESRQTSTYKESTTILNKGRAIYKEKMLTDVKVLLDKAEAIKNSKTTDAKALATAKSQAATAKEKLANIEKFSGSDADTTKAELRVNALLDKVESLLPECEEAECAKQGKVCNPFKGICEAKLLECPLSCMYGCSPKTNICKSEPPKCDEKACSEKGGTCETNTGSCRLPDSIQTKEELADEVRTALASPEGCGSATKLLEELRKAGGTADYYYYKAYCYGDSNPEKACDFYNRFLKVARSDTRASQAKQFINSQDSSTYTTCVTP